METVNGNTALIEGEAALSPEERDHLADAIRRLQASRGVVVRGADILAGALGGAAAAGLRGARFSPALVRKVQGLAELALRRAFDVAVLGLNRKRRFANPRGARFIVAASGAVSGFAGFAGFVPDMAFTTLLIMRAIADIARDHGEDLTTEEAKQACLEVFAFGGAEFGLEEDAEISYWSARLVLQGRPLVMLLAEMAGRYGLHVSQKFAMQAVPVVGAAGGALVNSVFFQHYRSLAQVHFTIRELERRHGPDLVRREAVAIAQRLRAAGSPARPIQTKSMLTGQLD